MYIFRTINEYDYPAARSLDTELDMRERKETMEVVQNVATQLLRKGHVLSQLGEQHLIMIIIRMAYS